MSDLDTLNKILLRRRSVFPGSFTGERIDDDLIKQLLFNANLAPSHRHTEPWRFHVFCDKSKELLSDFMQQCYRSSFSIEEINVIKLEKIKKNMSSSSHVVVIGMKRSEENFIPYWEEVAAVAAAVQNIYLSVAASGLAGYWSTPSYFLDSAKDFVQLEEDEHCLGLFYLGKPKNELPPQVIKRPVQEKTRWY